MEPRSETREGAVGLRATVTFCVNQSSFHLSVQLPRGERRLSRVRHSACLGSSCLEGAPRNAGCFPSTHVLTLSTRLGRGNRFPHRPSQTEVTADATAPAVRSGRARPGIHPGEGTFLQTSGRNRICRASAKVSTRSQCPPDDRALTCELQDPVFITSCLPPDLFCSAKSPWRSRMRMHIIPSTRPHTIRNKAPRSGRIRNTHGSPLRPTAAAAAQPAIIRSRWTRHTSLPRV
jgi:hypothetical protein